MHKVMVDVNHLKKGMYVSELDRPWLDSPFIFQGFRITNVDEVEQLKATCEFVFIDKEKSIIIIPQHAIYHPVANKKKKNKPSTHAPLEYQAPFEQELPMALNTYNEASLIISKFLKDSRLGTSLNASEINTQVSLLANSVIRHPDALMLLSSLKNKGDFAAHHALNVCILSLILGRYMGLDEEQLKELGTGALLHDIGETLVPTDILCKSGERTAVENKIRRSHTSHGVSILEKVKGIPSSAIAIARDHHERADGSGYPNKLINSQIDTFTKIVNISDVYDMATNGLYGNPSVSTAVALKKIYEWRKKLFDSSIVESFIQCLGIYPIGSVVEFRTGEVAIVLSAEQKTRLNPKVLMVRDQQQRSMLPPKVINLALLHENGIKDTYKISRVIKPETYDINVQEYIFNDLEQSIRTASA